MPKSVLSEKYLWNSEDPFITLNIIDLYPREGKLSCLNDSLYKPKISDIPNYIGKDYQL